MKYIITLVLITMLFSSQTLSQEYNRTIPSPYKGLIDKLSEIHNLKTDDSKDLNKRAIYPAALKNNRLIQVLKNLENKFYKTEELNNENSRTITTETLLADGFLNTEYIYQTWDGPTSSYVNNSRSIYLYNPRNKRVQSTYQNWTAGAWENNSRYSYAYDANDNQTESTYQTWNGTTWVNSSRSLVTYDVNNNYLEYIYQTWSGTAWTNNSRYSYTYDSNNNNTQYLYQTWNGTVWVDNSRTNYIYDANDNLIEYNYQTWSGTAWVNNSKSTRTFDGNNNVVEEIYQTWDGSTWVNDSRYTFTYDANDNQTLYLYQNWDVSVWKNNFQYTTAYDANNNPIENIYQSWDVTVWKNEYKYSYIYDANENLIENLYQSWDVSVWKNEYKYSYMYDSNNNRIEYLYQTWNVSVWENTSRSTTTYDSNNNYTEQIYQTWNGTSWDNQSRDLYTWASETSIVLTSPNGGENWPVGTAKNITWTSSNISNIKLQYSTNNGTNWINITNVSAGAGSYSWTIPNTISTNCKVLISDVSNALIFDESDSVFSITPAASVVVTAPDGGESWNVGSPYSITWTSVSIDTVKIDYSTNNGTNWINIVSKTPSDGSYNWTIPNTPSTNCKIQISDVTNALINDQSNNVFTIIVPVTPFINVTAPIGGENWDVGSTHSITWTSNVNDVKIDYSTNNGTSWTNIIASTPASAESYNWTVPNTPSTNCKVLISDVTNALINDQSNNVFTINVPATPVISVSSPNGGENWVVGSVHNITWISSNVTNIRIDYTTTGTDLINIITSTPASAQSYSWTVPNTASTNCKVIISDVSAPTITFDLSDDVFTIFTYPSTINLSATYSFGDATKTSSYQMIGLPGANNLLISSIVTGTQGATGEWRAFWDNGADNNYMIPFDGTSTFNLAPGKAFWIISKNQISVNQNVNAVTLAADNTYLITVHKGWNLISNPFDKSIPWSAVQNSNPGENQPLHYFQSGSYISPNPTQLEPYKGYYFKVTDSTRTSIKIPFFSTTALPKNTSASLSELMIALTSNDIQKASISIGISEDAKPGADMLDVFSPPSQFCDVNISLYNSELEPNHKYLQKDYRAEIGEGQEFSFSIKNLSDQTLNLTASGMDNFMNYEIFLVDKSLSKLYDLKKQNSFEVKANTAEKQYSILIGTEAFILQKKQELLPTEFALFQNYPNPFNPSTRIMFSLPLQSDVSLKIYNVLGELAADLINNQVFDAGYHEIMFDGSKLASGVYLYKLQTTSSGRQPFTEVKKMILIK